MRCSPLISVLRSLDTGETYVFGLHLYSFQQFKCNLLEISSSGNLISEVSFLIESVLAMLGDSTEVNVVLFLDVIGDATA
jgi:hypothetical protein